MKSGAWSAIAVASLVGLGVWGGAGAADAKLKGSFAGVGEAACLTWPSGFNANLTPIDPSTASTDASDIIAFFTFNKDGTGTLQESNVTVESTSASSSHALADFTFTAAKSGEITITSTDFSGTNDTGPRAGQTFTIDTWTVNAFAAPGNKAVGIATTTPFVEKLTLSNGGTPLTLPRICHREIGLLPF